MPCAPALIFAAYAALVGTFFASVFYWRVFPVCFVEGQGLTPFKIASEYVISALLLGAGLLLWRRRERLDRDVLQLLLASIGVTIAQELAFTLYADPYGLTNMLGHFLKIVAYYLVYRAIIRTGLVKPFGLLLRDLEQSNERLSITSVQAMEQAKIAEEQAGTAGEANARLVDRQRSHRGAGRGGKTRRGPAAGDGTGSRGLPASHHPRPAQSAHVGARKRPASTALRQSDPRRSSGRRRPSPAALGG